MYMIVSSLCFIVLVILRGRAPSAGTYAGTYKVAVPFFVAAGVVMLVTGVAVVFLPIAAGLVAVAVGTAIALVLIFAGGYRRLRAYKAGRLAS